MYKVDDKDIVVPIDDLPQCCTGAPLPTALRSEFATFVAYILRKFDPHWDGTTCRIVGGETQVERIVILQLKRCEAIMSGPPNDEAFSGHPLASRGLAPYGTFEVLHSSWIRTLERMNRVHSAHKPEHFAKYRHFVFSFHDSTLECVAEHIEIVEVFSGSMNGAMARMAELVGRH